MICSYDYWVGNTQKKSTLKTGCGGPPYDVEPRIYDVASLTKVVVTGTLLIQDALSSSMSLNTYQQLALSKVIPEIERTHWHNLTIGDLWNHRSGFRAHKLIFADRLKRKFKIEDRPMLHREILKSLLKEKRQKDAPSIYSDLGFCLLCVYIERKYQKNLQELWESFLEKEKLWGDYMTFCPGLEWRAKIIPTEIRHPYCEVNDDNAASMNGISTHAGLFASANDIKSWLFWMSQLVSKNKDLFDCLSQSGERFVCGWDSASREDGVVSQAGQVKSDFVRGFLGWTGTAFWWDIQSGAAAILLTNRVYPKHSIESQNNMKQLRHSFFSRVWQNDLNGLDQLLSTSTSKES